MNCLDKYKGCLIGGASGDALGYPVEFLNEKEIFQKYGDNGISEYDTVNGIAQISDDTQMSMFTATSLLAASTKAKLKREKANYVGSISDGYKDWFITQSESYTSHGKGNCCWLLDVAELFSKRAPGNTCISAILQGANGSIDKPLNNSKGCGAIMRVAPIGLYFYSKYYSFDEIDMIAAESSALTHGHELGYIPSAVICHIISLIAHDESFSLISAIESARDFVSKLFSNKEHIFERRLPQSRWL